MPSHFKIAVIWAQYGPYHLARVRALADLAGPANVAAIEFANLTRDYQWKRSPSDVSLITLCPNAVTERLPFATVFWRTRRKLVELGVRACLLPSYSPRQSLAALLAVKSAGIRAVMMNESHAGTSRATGLGARAKHALVSLFDAALVGGEPQKRHFTSLGLPKERIFTGYDAVDNQYYSDHAAQARTHDEELRRRWCLPQNYFLSLSRFVPKKNLPTLIRAYGKFRASGGKTSLVLVGSGPEENRLLALCRELGLPVFNSVERTNQSGVHFYGFRQIDEHPVLYALADAFVLPSLWEEWGLVVNEAMACGLPVVVSETAGCAEDLLEGGCELLGAEIDEAGLRPRARRNGFIFDPRSVDELSRIFRVLASSPPLRAAMGAASRQIIGKYSCQNFAENALAAAKAALNNRPVAHPDASSALHSVS